MGVRPNKRAETQAYQNAVGILLVGFVFALFTLTFFGIDILLDAVGWLLVFNGVRPLERPKGGIGVRASLCLGLVVVSAAQLFLTGGVVALLLLGARAALEAALFLLLISLFRNLLASYGRARLAVVFAGVLALSAVASLFPFLVAVLPGATQAAGVLQAAALGVHLLLVVGLLLVIFSLRNNNSERRTN